MILIDGKLCSKKRLTDVKARIEHQFSKTNLRPGLAVIRVGEDPASKIYVTKKVQTCREIGIQSFEFLLPEQTDQLSLEKLISQLNQRQDIHGILVQLPLPKHISEKSILEKISPSKDVDGFHPLNRGKLISQEATFVPCTPQGIMSLLTDYAISLEGKYAVVIGRSAIVGRPISLLLDHAGATVTVAHSKTKNLEILLSQADIIVAAIGKPHFLSTQKLKPGVVLIDVGINRLSDGSIVGDIDLKNYSEIASAATPVPGGVGPMTICSLLENTWQSFENFTIDSRK